MVSSSPVATDKDRMSGWWSLPQAAPILLRHLSAYAELVERDLAVAQRQIGARLAAIAVVGLAGLFTLLLICAAVIAATWDTPQRMTALYCMIGFFAMSLLIAVGYLSRINAQSDALFATVKREWALDRVVLDRLLAENHPAAGDQVPAGDQVTGEP